MAFNDVDVVGGAFRSEICIFLLIIMMCTLYCLELYLFIIIVFYVY